MNKQELIIKLYGEKIKGRSFKEIAEDLGIPQTRISKFIHRTSMPDKNMCEILNNYFSNMEEKN